MASREDRSLALLKEVAALDEVNARLVSLRMLEFYLIDPEFEAWLEDEAAKRLFDPGAE